MYPFHVNSYVTFIYYPLYIYIYIYIYKVWLNIWMHVYVHSSKGTDSEVVS